MNCSTRVLVGVAVALMAWRQAAAAPPGEVTNLQWCSGSAKDCITWNGLGAVQHRVYEGDGTTLPALLNASADSCLFRIWNAAATSGPGALTDLPGTGTFFWYLVVGKNCDGEGPSGNATAGARTLNSSGDCNPASCIDGMHNGAESNVDCGGGACSGCPNGSSCCAGIDCAGLVCQAGTCSVPSCADLVRNGTETDIDCGGGICPACTLGKTCNVGTDCQSGLCSGGVCTALGNGTNCSTSSQCASGNCVDGVCCNTACNSLCQSCNVTFGTCTNIFAGQDPDNECPGASTCNGAGSCAAPNGTSCLTNPDCQSGNCVDGVCCNSACGGTCQACNLPGSVGSCANIPNGQDPASECAGAATCNGAGACAAPNGTACVTNPECQSGNCVDGRCCNSACAGTCQACNLAGSLGTCANIPAGQDPANECPGAAACNGVGSCAFPNGTACTLATQCSSGNCVDSVCCNTACGATCQACNLAGSVGSCSFIPSGQDPAGECPGIAVCNGAGGCFEP